MVLAIFLYVGIGVGGFILGYVLHNPIKIGLENLWDKIRGL